MTFTEPRPTQGNGYITLADFYRAYTSFRNPPNREQADAIAQSPDSPLFLVAGPGTGKTTCLVLRILKLILVDGVPPNSILATTFTKKAADELRSRVLGWGFRVLETLRDDAHISPQTKARLARVDINQVLTGTIDSLCERILRDFRDPGTQPPIVVDDFVSKTLLLREGLLNHNRHQDGDLDTFLKDLYGSSWQWNVGKKVDLLQEIWDRRFQDQVDWNGFINSGRTTTDAVVLNLINEIIADYEAALSDRLMVDFALLEQEVLQRLRRNELTEFTDQIQVVLVDEYQDTNLLQEQIYLELARACGGAITVVGDDDQSLYRFRGATVELFSEFPQRYRQLFPVEPEPLFLTRNYRSTRNIIRFVNNYARLDLGYQRVRVADKPELIESPTVLDNLPILGMFRRNTETLAQDLANFIHQVFRGSGCLLPTGEILRCNADGGDLGDCAFLCSSPAEYNSAGKARIPLLLREELRSQTPAIEIFNPRGQDLPSIPIIQLFGGLLLSCLDVGEVVQSQTSGISNDTQAVFAEWRRVATDFALSGQAPDGLFDYAVGWARRASNPDWKRSVPVLELVYGLVHFFPSLHDDPEGQVYLEVFTRQVSACQQVGDFSARVISDQEDPDLSDASVRELLRNFLVPIASGTVKVNEDLMDAFPRDRLSILSIHQSKGLEFPLTIVDVGAEFSGNYAAQRFKRFPDKGGTPHSMEDLLCPHTSLRTPGRGGRDRSFDDLYRQFFVAYSRPQEVLLLVGLDATLPDARVPNVATGWSRDSVAVWGSNYPFIRI